MKRADRRPSIVLLNKPYGVLCQFSDGQGRATLADYISIPDVYPAGRLDRDSEGLVLLTADGRLQHRITDPHHKLRKVYCVQLEGQATDYALSALTGGLSLKDGLTEPCQVRLINEPAWLWQRDPPIRHRAKIPTSWIQISLTEGRNRQVRRMTAAVGFPTLRLIRVRVGPWGLGHLLPGQSRVMVNHATH